MEFDLNKEITKEIDRQIGNAKADVESALRFLVRITEETAIKLETFQKEDNNFSQDLNAGSAGARLQAATSALAALVGQRANIRACIDFDARNKAQEASK